MLSVRHFAGLIEITPSRKGYSRHPSTAGGTAVAEGVWNAGAGGRLAGVAAGALRSEYAMDRTSIDKAATVRVMIASEYTP